MANGDGRNRDQQSDPERKRTILRRPRRPRLVGGLLVVVLAVSGAALAPPSVDAMAPTGLSSWWPWLGLRPRVAPKPPLPPVPSPAPSTTGVPTAAPPAVPPKTPAPSISSPPTVPETGTGGMDHGGMDHGGMDHSGTFVNPYVPVDASKIPVGSTGSGEKLIGAGGQRGASDNGEFRTVCTYSHMAFDDPIVKPGQSGTSHLHSFFGNTGTTGNSTAESIRNSGNSTCRGGILNRSAYWVPSLIDTRTGAPVRPTHIDGYYKNGFGGVKAADIHPLPQGLRIVAGSAMATGPQTRQTGQWGCDDGSSRPYRFWDHVPDYCAAGDVADLEVDFPQCWDGTNLDSADHKSHMAYTLDGSRGCPASHPVAIPAISIIVHWPVPAGAAARDLRLASDMYPTGSPGGYSWHGDWFNGWDEATMQSWVQNCNNAGKNCFSDLIADGRSLYGER